MTPVTVPTRFAVFALQRRLDKRWMGLQIVVVEVNASELQARAAGGVRLKDGSIVAWRPMAGASILSKRVLFFLHASLSSSRKFPGQRVKPLFWFVIVESDSYTPLAKYSYNIYLRALK